MRTTFDIYNSAVRILQRDDYYAFGLRKAAVGGTNNPADAGYNGKELQEELGQYDYGARLYDPVIGRWNVIDPLAEKHYGVSGYAYVLNNPIAFIGPFGLDTVKAANLVANRPDVKQFDTTKDVVQLNEVTITTSAPSKSIVEQASDIWNSPLARSMVPNKLTLSISSSVTAYMGFSQAMSFDFITRGHDASIIPYATFTIGVQGGPGASEDALIGFGGGYYATTDMRSLAPGEAAEGLKGWSVYGSVDGGFGFGGSITGSVGFSKLPLISAPTWISATAAGGASIGAGGTAGVSYSFPIFKSQFEK